MSRPLRIVLGTLAVLAALFVALVAFVALRFDPNAYRPLVVDTITTRTGRTFDLEGELGLQLFPCCAIAVGRARLGNPAGFVDEDFAGFESATASVRIWPLLRRREVEIATIRIDGLTLDLVRRADGRANWNFAADAPAELPEGSSGGTMAALRVDAIEAAGARLRYRDLANGSDYAATDIQLRTGAVLYHGALSIELLELLLTLSGAPLPNGRAVVALAADRFEFTPVAGTLDIAGLALQIDDTSIVGDVAIADTGTLGFDLTIDRLDLDALLPAAPETGAAPAADAPPAQIPLEPIRRLDLVGNLRVGELVFYRLRWSGVEASLRATNGVLSIDPLAAGLYDGQYHGTVAVDATGRRAVVTLVQQFSGIQLGQALQARYGSELLAGDLTASITATGSGTTADEAFASLAGDVSLDLANGVYRGFDFMYELRRALALVKGRVPPPQLSTRETPIKALDMRGRLANGVLHSDAINIEIPAVEIRGKGDLDLLEFVLDHRFDATLRLATEDGLADSGLEDLDGKSVPFTVKGPVEDPKVRIDLEGLLAGEVQGALQRGLRKLLGGKPED